MSRYLERAENQARFIDVTSNIALGYRGSEEVLWSSLLHAGGDTEEFQSRYSSTTRENVIRYLLFDKSNLNSVVSCLNAARENARTIRENLTTPMWEAVNRFYLRVRAAAGDASSLLRYPHPFLEQIKRSAHQVIGVTEATWSRGEAWQFSTLGYQLERADKTSRILDVKYFLLLPAQSDNALHVDAVQWGALLESTGGLQMYRRAFGRIQPRRVVEFLVLNGRFPRSVRFCVRAAEHCLREISGMPEPASGNSAVDQMTQLRLHLEGASVDAVLDSGLHHFVDGIQTQLNAAGHAVSETFFHVPIPGMVQTSV